MTDEASALLRIAAFGLVASLVYWLVTYEYFGTVGLLALSLGPGYAGLLIYYETRRRHLAAPAPFTDQFRRFAGLPRPDKVEEEPLEADDLAVIPSPSIWPFLLSIGVAVLMTGLIFGAWLVVIGSILIVWGIWGWVRAANLETIASARASETGVTGAGSPSH